MNKDRNTSWVFRSDFERGGQMVKSRLKVKEKYMFESIYDSLVSEKIRHLERDIGILSLGLANPESVYVNTARVARKFKAHMKDALRDIGQDILIADINEAREGVFEFWTMNPALQYELYIERFFDEPYYDRFITKHYKWYERVELLLDNGYDYLLEIINNYLKDIHDLVEADLIKEAEEYMLNEVEFIGDRKDGSRCAVRCKIGNENLLYRPESGRLYELYGKVIRLVSDNDRYRTLNILKGKKYYWCEFVKNERCHKDSEINEFYKNSGYMLAAAYLMNATDVDNSNIYAVGKYPIIMNADIHETAGHDILGDMKVMEKSEIEIEGEFTSEAKIHSIRRKCLSNTTHLPRLGKEGIPVYNYVADVLEGFAEGYGNMIKNKDKLIQLIDDRVLKRRYESPIDSILDKLDHLSDSDKKRQLTFINNAFNYR